MKVKFCFFHTMYYVLYSIVYCLYIFMDFALLTTVYLIIVWLLHSDSVEIIFHS